MAANIEAGKFSLNIGGKERVGRIDMEAMCRIEQELGGASLFDRISGKGWGIDTVCTVLWVGLSRENPQITKRHIQKWIQTGLDEGARLEDYVMASQKACVCALGVRVRSGVDDVVNDRLPDVDKDDAKGGDGEVVDGGPLGLKASALRSA